MSIYKNYGEVRYKWGIQRYFFNSALIRKERIRDRGQADNRLAYRQGKIQSVIDSIA